MPINPKNGTLALILVVLLIFQGCFSASAQGLEDLDNTNLKRIIDTFIQNHDGIKLDRKTEMTILVLEVDTSGKISNIHLLSDENRRDQTYFILRLLTAETFHHRTFRSYAARIICIPVITVSENSQNWGYSDFMRAANNENFGTSKNIWVKTVYYWMPEYSIENVSDRTGRNLDSLPAKKPVKR